MEKFYQLLRLELKLKRNNLRIEGHNDFAMANFYRSVLHCRIYNHVKFQTAFIIRYKILKRVINKE